MIHKFNQDHHLTMTDQDKRSIIEACTYIAVAMELRSFLQLVGLQKNWEDLSPNFDNINPVSIPLFLSPMFPRTGPIAQTNSWKERQFIR